MEASPHYLRARVERDEELPEVKVGGGEGDGEVDGKRAGSSSEGAEGACKAEELRPVMSQPGLRPQV